MVWKIMRGFPSVSPPNSSSHSHCLSGKFSAQSKSCLLNRTYDFHAHLINAKRVSRVNFRNKDIPIVTWHSDSVTERANFRWRHCLIEQRKVVRKSVLVSFRKDAWKELARGLYRYHGIVAKRKMNLSDSSSFYLSFVLTKALYWSSTIH